MSDLEKALVDTNNEDSHTEEEADNGSIHENKADEYHKIPVIKRKVKALKKIQTEVSKIEAEFYEEAHKLECKYEKRFEPFYAKRMTIISGKYEPTEEECDVKSDTEEESDEDNDNDDDKSSTKENGNKGEVPSDIKGIPKFWLHVFQNVSMLETMIQPNDVPILEKLVDITVTLKESNPMGFTLHFHFAPNDYFTNNVLTKQYYMKCDLSEGPCSFEGPEIFKCTGCKIDWNSGKNVTMKVIQKRQKHAKKAEQRVITKDVQLDSFFNFFNPPEIPDDPQKLIDTDLQDLMAADFEIGHFLRDKVVPKAVYFFTGEASDCEDDDSDDNFDSYDEEDDSDDDEVIDKNPNESEKCQQQ